MVGAALAAVGRILSAASLQMLIFLLLELEMAVHLNGTN